MSLPNSHAFICCNYLSVLKLLYTHRKLSSLLFPPTGLAADNSPVSEELRLPGPPEKAKSGTAGSKPIPGKCVSGSGSNSSGVGATAGDDTTHPYRYDILLYYVAICYWTTGSIPLYLFSRPHPLLPCCSLLVASQYFTLHLLISYNVLCGLSMRNQVLPAIPKTCCSSW